MVPKNHFNCIENTENGGTQMWLESDPDCSHVHVLGQWENGTRKELVVCLDNEQLTKFQRQVADLKPGK